MTLRAHKVLSDCKRTHEMLELATQDDSFRILWVAGIALTRAVGHVLHRVDSKQDPLLAKIVGEKYKWWQRDKPSFAIFWEFIEDERNRVLKEYEHGFLAGPIVVVAAGEQFTVGENLFIPLSDGKYAGEDCRDVLEQAILWWDVQLSDIEVQYRKLKAD